MTILTSAHRCSVCGGPTVPPSEPITIGGWYGDHHYTWDRGRPYLTSVKCARCRVRDDFTILEMGDGVFLLPCRTMLAPNWGRYRTHQDAMDALHAMALEEFQGIPKEKAMKCYCGKRPALLYPDPTHQKRKP